MRILVLEANARVFREHTLRYMELMLPIKQIEVVRAGTITEAFPLIESEPFDLIVYDLLLPKPYEQQAKLEDGSTQAVLFRSGMDLFAYRLHLEKQGKLPKSRPVLFTSTVWAARPFLSADKALLRFSKLQVDGLINLIKAELEVRQRAPKKEEVPLAQEV